MAKMKKKDVIKALMTAGVEFDADGKYNNLSKLLKDITPLDASPKESSTPKSELIGYFINDATYNRARNVVGMTVEQIASYPDAESLVKALNRMHPKSNPEARVKSVEVPVVARVEDKLPDKIEFESKLEYMSMSNRVQFDEQNLQLELRKINRKYGAQKPVRIVADKSNKPVTGKDKKNRMAKYLITKYTVYYK